MIVYPIMPEEDVRKWVDRLSILNGQVGTTKVWRAMTGSNRTLSALIPIGLDSLSDFLGFEDKEYLIKEHTGVPASKPWLAGVVYEQIISGLRGDGSPALGSLNSGKNHRAIRYCVECVRSDNKNGFPYIRRAHCLPGSYVCPIHHCYLTEGCGQCEWSLGGTLKAMIPSETCMCGRPLIPCIAPVSKKDFDFLVRVAEFEFEFMTKLAVSGINRGQIGLAYKERIAEIGISTMPQFIRFAGARVGNEALNILRFPIAGNERLRGIIFDGVPPWPSVAYNGIMFSLLFDCMQDAIDSASQFEWVAKDSIIRECRGKIEEIIDRSGVKNSKDIYRATDLEWEYLRDFDSEWLGEMVNRLNVERPFEKWRGSFSKNFDEKLSKYMEERLSILLDDSRRPRKITFSLLISGFCESHIPKSALMQMPLSRAVFERVSEDPLNFQVRLLHHIENHQNMYSHKSYEYTFLRRILSRAKVESLVELSDNKIVAEVKWIRDRYASYRLKTKERQDGRRDN